MSLIQQVMILNIVVGIANIVIATWQFNNGRVEYMVYNMLLAICSFLIAIVLSIISNRE